MKARIPLLAVAALVSTLTFSPGASASHDRLIRYAHARGPISAGGDQTITVPCPAGTKIVGASGAVARTANRVSILRLHIDAATNSAVVGAHNASMKRQRLKAFATCYQGPTTPSYFQAVQAVPNGAQTSVGESCVVLTDTVIGGGAGFAGPTYGGLTLSDVTRVVNNSGMNFWEARGENDSGATQNLVLQSVCFAAGTVSVVQPTRQATVRPGRTRTLTVKCPKGTTVSDGGFDLPGGTLLTSVPFDGRDRDHAPDDGWKVRAKNIGTTPGTLKALAVCVS